MRRSLFALVFVVLRPGAAAGDEPRYETVVRASPAWTQDRNFPGTRFWVLDPGRAEFELWWRGEFARAGEAAHLLQFEVELGLTRRVQLDLYENVSYDARAGWQHEGNQIELRVAIPDEYGKIFGNPTIYLEWHPRHGAPDRAEARILVGGALGPPRLHGAANLFFEQNVDTMPGAPFVAGKEFGATAAATYEMIDDILRLGIEARVDWTDGAAAGALDGHAYLGPNFVLRYWGDVLKIYATVWFGLTPSSDAVRPFVILASAL